MITIIWLEKPILEISEVNSQGVVLTPGGQRPRCNERNDFSIESKKIFCSSGSAASIFITYLRGVDKWPPTSARQNLQS